MLIEATSPKAVAAVQAKVDASLKRSRIAELRRELARLEQRKCRRILIGELRRATNAAFIANFTLQVLTSGSMYATLWLTDEEALKLAANGIVALLDT